MRYTLILIAEIVAALRHVTVTSPDDDCVVKTCALVAAGHYEVQGMEARLLSRQLQPQQYFVGSSCDEAPEKDASATVVQWLDAEDPYNKSSIAIYVNPLMKKMVQGEPTKLCTNENQKCLCELTGNKQFGAFARLAFVLPSTVSQKCLAMHLRCPSGVLDALTAVVLLLLLLPVVAITSYVAWKALNASEPQMPQEWKSVQVKNPMENFVESYSWSAGFLMSLASLQMGTLLFVRKSSEEEAFVWFIAAFPAILALAGASRLCQVMCKMQLANACLGQGYVLTEPMDSSAWDVTLLTALILYLLAVLWSVSSSFMAIILALVALAGSTWALMKAIRTPRALEKKLKTLEVHHESLKKTEVANLKFVPWEFVISAGRLGNNIHRSISKATEQEKAQGDRRTVDVHVGDTLWHGRAIVHLTGSRAGFLALPSLLLLVTASLIISAFHVSTYACSRGQLLDLQLASSLHSLHFAPWQKTYEVLVDTSFRQVTMVASSEASATRWISLTQPDASATSPPSQMQIDDNSSGSMVAEIHLAPRHVPRLAQVHLQGLRPSLDPTEYKVRFSPVMTMPTAVKITGGGFTQTVAWSALPGATISVPAGTDGFTIDVMLADFVLDFPVPPGENHSQDLWTVFEKASPVNDTFCAAKCRESINCFDHFLSDFGCYYVEGNRSRLEAGTGHAGTSMWLSELSDGCNLSGKLIGCNQEADNASSAGTCDPPVMMSEGLLRFKGVKPDWRGKLATISFLLILEVGGQQFQSEADSIPLRQGPPVPNDAIGVLMMESQGQTSILPCNFSIDSLGNVIVDVPEYDPLNVTGMNLSVIPLQTDQAFEVDWDPQPPELDLPVDFLEHSKCRNSSFLRSRYQLCGAKHGIETKAVTMSIDPWTGRLDSPLRFAIVPKDGEKAQLPPAEPHNVVLKFLVDSPAAWAAKAHHCALLQESEAVQRSLLESADATCQLLQTCTNETLLQQLCEAIDETALGGDHAYYDDVRGKPVHYPPLLPPQGVVKVLTCLQNSPCEKKPNRWVYNETEPGVMHLDDHGAKVPINSLVAQLEQMDKEEALAWFGSQEVESTSADSVSFDKELVKTAWEVGHLETLPKLLVVLGDWKDHMPQLLMEELVASRRMDLAKLKDMAMPDIELKMLRKTFQPVENLAAKLVDAEQLGLTPVAMKFAENLQGLRIDCFRCSHVAKSPSRQDLDQLFGQHSDLKSLDMKDFYMEALLPEKVFQGLSSLRTLSLSKNQLTELPDQVFQGLSNLTTLSLQSNQLTTLPDHIFQGLSKLTTLILHSNQITLPDQVFQGLSKLTTLELQGNRLTKLPDQVFQGLSKLTELNIGDNSLKKLPRHVFQDLSNLRTLDVYWNKFTKLPDHIFQGLSNLTTLKISCNQLTTLPDQVFQGLSKLTELNIASNQLTTLPDRIFQGLSNLTTLSLPYNPFATLPDVFQGLSKLTELDIADIKLKELPDHVFQAKSSLTTLKLSSNQLTKLPDHVFQNLSNLTTLDLEKNQLTKLPDHVFQGLSKLTTLHLHWNQLTKLPDHVFQGLSKLTELDIRNNELKELPDRVLQGLSNLATLDLSSNQLTTLPDHVFQGLSNLTTLDLQANRLTKLPDHVFQGLTSLTTLKLSSRQLTKLPDHVFQGLSNLTTLNLQYNQLTTLPDHVFQGLSKLTTLHLQGNRLTKLPDQVFQGLSKLTELNIGNNKLKELPDRVLQGLSNVTILGLKRQKY